MPRRQDNRAIEAKPPQILSGYLTESQLAEELGVKRRTLWRWRAAGIGPPTTKIGRELYFRVEALHEWLQSHEKRMPREHAGRRITKPQHDNAA